MTTYLFIGLFVAIVLLVILTLVFQKETPNNAPDINNLRRGIHSQRRQP